MRVPVLISAVAIDTGTDLVARFGQFGIYGYGIQRVQLTGPRGIVSLYKGFISPGTMFSSVQSDGTADAQFTPVETVHQGNDVIVVWEGGTGYAGTAYCNITTDGGAL